MTRTVSRLARGAALLPLALLPSAALPLVSAAPAWADSVTSSATTSNWYWAESGTPVPSNVADGELGVGALPSQDPDKATALRFDRGGIPDGATVTRFTVTMPLSDNTQEQVSNGFPAVVMCRNTSPFAPAPGPSAMAGRPTVDDASCVEGKADTRARAYSFDIARIAQAWQTGAPDDGVSVLPKPSDGTPFSLAFKGAVAIRVTGEFSAPPAAAATSATTTGSTAATGASAGRPGSTSRGTGGGSAPSQGSFVAPPPLPAPAPVPVPIAAPLPATGAVAPAAVAPAAAPAPAPVAAPQPVAAPALAPAASTALPVSDGVGLGFVGAALGLLAVLVAASWTLGGADPDVRSDAGGRLEGLVRERRRSAASGRSATGLAARLA